MGTFIPALVPVNNGVTIGDGTGDTLPTGANIIKGNNTVLATAINQLASSLGSALKPFATKADLIAAQAGLPVGTVAVVWNDATQANNIPYVWDGTTLNPSFDRPTYLMLTALGNVSGFIQSGAGSVLRTFGDKAQDTVSPFDKMTAAQAADARSGAKTLDLTVPIQAAINTAVARGIPVDFRGVIAAKVTALTVGAGGKLIGSGAKLDFSAAGAIAGITCGSGVSITGFGELLGPGNATYQAASMGIVAKGTLNAGLAPTFIKGPYIRDNTIRGWGAYGVYMEHCDAPDVQWNTINNIGYNGIGGLGCTNGTADHNKIDTIGPGTSGNTYGIAWSRLSTQPTELENPRSYDCTANFNKISNAPLWEGIDTHAGVNIQIMHNTFDNVGTPVALVGSKISGVNALAPQRCKARFNTVKNAVANVAFSVAGVAGVEYAENCEISDNECDGGGIPGSDVNGVVRAVVTKGFQCHNNKLRNGYAYGVCLINDNLNFSITGGSIKDMSDATVTTCAGVAIRSNNNTGYIGGVSFIRENTALPNVMVNSVLLTSGSTGIDISVGPCKFTGDTSASLTLSLPVAIPTATAQQAMTASGSGTIAQVSGATSNLVDIVFTQPMPATPKVRITRTSVPSTGGKSPDLQTTLVTRNGFRVIARPYDLASWSASGSLTFDWSATL